MTRGRGVYREVFCDVCIAQSHEPLLRQEFIADEDNVCEFGI